MVQFLTGLKASNANKGLKGSKGSKGSKGLKGLKGLKGSKGTSKKTVSTQPSFGLLLGLYVLFLFLLLFIYCIIRGFLLLNSDVKIINFLFPPGKISDINNDFINNDFINNNLEKSGRFAMYNSIISKNKFLYGDFSKTTDEGGYFEKMINLFKGIFHKTSILYIETINDYFNLLNCRTKNALSIVLALPVLIVKYYLTYIIYFFSLTYYWGSELFEFTKCVFDDNNKSESFIDKVVNLISDFITGKKIKKFCFNFITFILFLWLFPLIPLITFVQGTFNVIYDNFLIFLSGIKLYKSNYINETLYGTAGKSEISANTFILITCLFLLLIYTLIYGFVYNMWEFSIVSCIISICVLYFRPKSKV